MCHLDKLLECVAGALAVLELRGQLGDLSLQVHHTLRSGLSCLLQLRQLLLQCCPAASLLPQTCLSLQWLILCLTFDAPTWAVHEQV